MFKKLLVTMVIVGLCIVQTAFAQTAASTVAPGGIPREQVPQFIIIGSDDNINAEAMRWMADVISNGTNRDGSNRYMTFYVNTRNSDVAAYDWKTNAELVAAALHAYILGHSIGNHTDTHIRCVSPTSRMSDDAIFADIKAASDKMIAAGIPKEHQFGFRTPFLSYSDSTYTAMNRVGFMYDASMFAAIIAGFAHFPYTLDAGTGAMAPDALGNIAPDNRGWWGGAFNPDYPNGNPIREHKGLWTIPISQVGIDPADMESIKEKGAPDYITHPEWGGWVGGFDYNMWMEAMMDSAETLRALMRTVRMTLDGNRAPISLAFHSQYYFDAWFGMTQQQKQGLFEEFVRQASQLENVFFVSGDMVIRWMQNPVPASEFDPENYRREEGIFIVWDEQKEFTFNGEEQAPTATARFANGIEVAIKIIGAINAGEHIATVELDTAISNVILFNATKEFTINRARPTPRLIIHNVMVGTPLSMNVDGNIGNGEVTYLYSTTENGEYSTITQDAPTEIGDYWAKAIIAETPNSFGAITPTIRFSISEVPIINVPVLWSEQTSFVYNSSEQGLTATVDGYEIVIRGNKEINAGNYTATVELNPFIPNVNLQNPTQQFTINKRDVRVIWSDTTLQWNGEAQVPTAITDWGNYSLTLSGHGTNVGNNFVIARLASPNSNINLLNDTIRFTINQRRIDVEWENKGPFVFNWTAQRPIAKPEIIRRDDGSVIREILFNVSTNQDVFAGNHTATATARIDEWDLPNISLSVNRFQDFVIQPRELTPRLRNTGNRITTPQGLTKEQLDSILTIEIDFDNFATNTQTQKTDDKSVLEGGVRFRIQNDNSQNSLRSQGALASGEHIVAISGESQNYTIPERKIVVIIGERFLILENYPRDNPTSISDVKKSDSRYGIRFALNPVSDKAEISVILPNNEKATETKIAIYDMTGNVVHSEASTASTGSATTATGVAIVWDLRNSAGRFVANGTYLVIAEVKDRNGRAHTYSARLGVRR